MTFSSSSAGLPSWNGTRTTVSLVGAERLHDSLTATKALHRVSAGHCAASSNRGRAPMGGAGCAAVTSVGTMMSYSVSRTSTSRAAPVFGWVSSFWCSAQRSTSSW